MSLPVKKPEEILKIAKVEAMGDVVFEHLLEYIKPGMTELDITNELETTFKKLGATDMSFPTIVVSGVNTVCPHGVPTDKKIEEGDFLTMDFGGVYEGYCSDMTRTVAISYATDEMKKIYDIVLDAQLSGLKALKAGEKCINVDKVCRDIITSSGYGEFYIHGTGHGVGELIHEAPYINTRSDEVLEEDMVVTMEPGIYIPDKFGVRIEDTVVVTKFGIVNLAKSPKDLIIL